jgi:SAM-dependent methyltransferase
MCNSACIEFGRVNLNQAEVMDKKVLEVGSLNVNGSLRELVEKFKPSSYVGVDIVDGPGVDEICNINGLVARFGKERFDLVISTELLEHALNWRLAISNLKNVLTPNGILLITTRSKGFFYHGYPFDYWRYELEDLRKIFSDFSIDVVESDRTSPGVFLKAHKPNIFAENSLDSVKLYSIISNRRCKNIGAFTILLFKLNRTLRSLLSQILPYSIKQRIKRQRIDSDRI